MVNAAGLVTITKAIPPSCFVRIWSSDQTTDAGPGNLWGGYVVTHDRIVEDHPVIQYMFAGKALDPSSFQPAGRSEAEHAQIVQTARETWKVKFRVCPNLQCDATGKGYTICPATAFSCNSCRVAFVFKIGADFCAPALNHYLPLPAATARGDVEALSSERVDQAASSSSALDALGLRVASSTSRLEPAILFGCEMDSSVHEVDLDCPMVLTDSSHSNVVCDPVNFESSQPSIRTTGISGLPTLTNALASELDPSIRPVQGEPSVLQPQTTNIATHSSLEASRTVFPSSLLPTSLGSQGPATRHCSPWRVPQVAVVNHRRRSSE